MTLIRDENVQWQYPDVGHNEKLAGEEGGVNLQSAPAGARSTEYPGAGCGVANQYKRPKTQITQTRNQHNLNSPSSTVSSPITHSTYSAPLSTEPSRPTTTRVTSEHTSAPLPAPPH